MDKIIGVKYCGGCNPEYNRSAAIEEWWENIVPVQEHIEYDIILLVCGCRRACIKDYRETKAAEYIVIDNLEVLKTYAKELGRNFEGRVVE